MSTKQTSITINNEDRDRLRKLFPNHSPAIALRTILDLLSEKDCLSEWLGDVFSIRLRTIDSEKREKRIRPKEADLLYKEEREEKGPDEETVAIKTNPHQAHDEFMRKMNGES